MWLCAQEQDGLGFPPATPTPHPLAPPRTRVPQRLPQPARVGAEPEVGTPQLLVDWFADGLYGFMTKRCSEDWLRGLGDYLREWGPGSSLLHLSLCISPKIIRMLLTSSGKTTIGWRDSGGLD